MPHSGKVYGHGAAVVGMHLCGVRWRAAGTLHFFAWHADFIPEAPRHGCIQGSWQSSSLPPPPPVQRMPLHSKRGGGGGEGTITFTFPNLQKNSILSFSRVFVGQGSCICALLCSSYFLHPRHCTGPYIMQTSQFSQFQPWMLIILTRTHLVRLSTSSVPKALLWQSAEGGEGKDKRERIIVVVRSPCQENYLADAHPSTHKSVLESANLAWTRIVHLDAPGQWHGQQPVSGTANRGVVKPDKSSKGSVDTGGALACLARTGHLF